jgi:hypothetical protein
VHPSQEAQGPADVAALADPPTIIQSAVETAFLEVSNLLSAIATVILGCLSIVAIGLISAGGFVEFSCPWEAQWQAQG